MTPRTTDGSGLRKRQRGFAAVPNQTVWDRDLSARALGVLVKVIALPVDWDLRMDWLVQQFPEGRDAITTAVRELRRCGYYRVERRRRDDGTFTSGVSVSDVRVPEWVAQHADACTDQGTDRPRWDVSLRVLPDGSLEDEPTSDDDPPSPPPVTDGDEADTPADHWESVSGEPVSGEPVTGLPDVKPQTDTHPGGSSRGVSPVSRATDSTPPEDIPPAVPSPASPDEEPIGRCELHLERPAAGACPPCGDARRLRLVWLEARADEARERDALERAAAARARADADAEQRGCGLCDEDGFAAVPYVDPDQKDGSPGERGTVQARCLHDGERNRRALAERRATRRALEARPRRADSTPHRPSRDQRKAG